MKKETFWIECLNLIQPKISDQAFETWYSDVELIELSEPDVIITWGPDGGTNHLDHRLVSTSVTQVFLSKKWNKEISLYYYGTPNHLIKDKKNQTLRGQEKKIFNN